MEHYTILWLGVFSEQVKQMMRRQAPEHARLLFTDSKADREEHLRLLAQADYVAPNGILMTPEYIRAAKKLKLIQLWGAGVDKYDQALLRACNIALQNGVGLNAAAVAEMTVLHILAVNRRLPYVDRELRRGRWLKSEMRDQCSSVYGKTVGLVGMGNIGRRVSKMLHGLDVAEILYYDAFRLSPEQERELDVTFCPLDELIPCADILSLHIPLTEQTKGMISRERITAMKPDAILINTARGGLVDEEALIEALQAKKIRGAGLDTFAQEPPSPDNPLFRLDNVVLTSHGGGAVIENIRPRIQHVYDCIEKFEHGEPIDPKFVILERRSGPAI